ncbi:MAG TPA: heat-inducible transcriptional repressor HrcA [Thermoleophilaceae bacterium]|nr:heat-inducible transcriptional repressor HrcA [Thermoleophilaceae bacterium]
MDLSERQAFVLRKVIEGYVEVGQPVGSRWLADLEDVPWKPSTVRSELARLEEIGMLQHPHTSAGRVPTDRGYRYYADLLLHDPPPREPLGLELTPAEVDEAMRVTTEQLSQVTNMLAIVSAPPIAATTIKHVEVLLLQPQLAMVVVITSTGGVTKRVFAFDDAVDRGIVDWAREYLNETLGGMDLGRRMLHAKLDDPELGARERAFLRAIAPAFTELEETAEHTLYVDGAARLLSEHRVQELSQINDLMNVLERRVALLAVLREALGEQSVYVRIGSENRAPEMHSLTLVAANYGLAHRNLGAVSVIGPVRMDYATAIASVREAAAELSRFVARVWE